MGRAKRAADGGLIYHVLNRGNARMTIFGKDGDYEAFESILEQAVAHYGTEILAWCLMPNHWHLVVKPHEDGELSRFVGWLDAEKGCRKGVGNRFLNFGEKFITLGPWEEPNVRLMVA